MDCKTMNLIILAFLIAFVAPACNFTMGSDDDDDTDTVIADDDDNDDDAPIDDDDDTIAPFDGCDELWTTVTPPGDFDSMCNMVARDLLDLEQQMFAMINADRAEHSEEANEAAPLQYDCEVAEVARIHSYDMCIYSLLYQTFEGGLTPEEIADNPIGRYERYLGLTFDNEFFWLGENVAFSDNLQLAEDHFVENETPCDYVNGSNRLNILDYNFSHVGIGLCDCEMPPGNSSVYDATDYLYITQDFITFERDFIKTDKNPYCSFEWQ
jgi:uncharacterized protein YkwD